MSGDYETYEWYDTPYGEFRVEQKRFGTWSSFMVRMVRRSSPHLRKKFAFQERDSTWKVSLLTGKTVGLPSLLMESLEENYEES